MRKILALVIFFVATTYSNAEVYVGGNLATVRPFPAVSYDTVTNGLLGWWRFDEGKGQIVHDYSGNGRHTTVPNGALWVRGPNGFPAVSLNNPATMTTLQVMDVAGMPALGTQDRTLCAWVQVRTPQAYGAAAVAEYGNYAFGQNCYVTVANASFGVGGWGPVYEYSVTHDGQWRHAVGVFSGGLAKLYINGVLVASGAFNLNTDERFLIGGISTYTYYYNGNICDVRAYDRSLSQAEIQSIYAETAIPTRPRMTPALAGGYGAVYQGETLVSNPSKKSYSNYVGIVYAKASDFYYSISANQVTITGYKGKGGQVNIPPTIDGFPVTVLGSSCFAEAAAILTGVRIPETVAEIRDLAFQGCSGLSGTLALPSGLTSIGDWTFAGCSGLSGSLVLPSGLTSIGAVAFYNCTGLSNIYAIPLTAPSLGSGAFNSVSATVYYRADATGYTQPWGGLTTAIWIDYPSIP